MPLIIISWEKEKHCDVPEFVRETAGQSQTKFQEEKQQRRARRMQKKLSSVCVQMKQAAKLWATSSYKMAIPRGG